VVEFGLLSSGQVYYVREMIAALSMFSVLFSLVAIAALIVFVLGRAGDGALAWAEKRCGLEKRTSLEEPRKNRFELDLAPGGLEFVEVKIATLPQTVSTVSSEDESVFDLVSGA
jgi:hypothetical protein